MTTPITIVPTSIVSGIDVPDDLQQCYVNFITKGLQNIYPTTTEEQVLPIAIHINKLMLICSGEIEGDPEKGNLEYSELLTKLEEKIELDIDEEKANELDRLVEDLIEEAGEEVKLYAINRAAELLFGPPEPGTIVVASGSSFNKEDWK